MRTSMEPGSIFSWGTPGAAPPVFPRPSLPSGRLEFPRETGLILRCAGKAGNPFQTIPPMAVNPTPRCLRAWHTPSRPDAHPHLAPLCILSTQCEHHGLRKALPAVWPHEDALPCSLTASVFLFDPWYSPGKNTGVGCHPLLQGIFPTQGLNLSFLHCLHYRKILNH